ncbi:MAG: glycosyltransferase [Planctomycetota bacterium]|jgi:trehalose synthase
MIDLVSKHYGFALSDYSKIAVLTGPVAALRGEAARLRPRLQGRTVWMVNSTAQGGGVAEMLPPMVSLLEELGVATRWAVIGSDDPRFFSLTKRLHNLIHGRGDPKLSADDREIYEAVNRENAAALKPRLKPGDILVVHDPQPLPLGAILKREIGITTVWRCHIGLDRHLPQTRAAWTFLRPYAETYDHAVFSAGEYVPDYLEKRASVIHPGIDPCSHKNRDLSPHKLVGVLCNAGLKKEQHPVLTPPFSALVQRLNGTGRFEPASNNHETGLLYRPIVTQISRWDRLKGFEPLLQGFLKLKERVTCNGEADDRHRHRLALVRLVLAGPDPGGVQDDPESQEVLDELARMYRALPAEQRQDVALLKLPMGSIKENALMVNVLQRCSTVVVQNSICEGFGLTATEAMWKGVPFVGTYACGIRQQVRDKVDGILTKDPEDPEQVARNLDAMLRDPMGRDVMGRSAQHRVHRRFLIFTQLRLWLGVLAGCAER